jgi:[acyl-carrier-protein] S-malonyltransferase
MSPHPEPSRTAFLFPGLGQRWGEEEAAFAASHRPLLAPLLEAATARSGRDLRRLLDHGSPPVGDAEAMEQLTHAFNLAVARSLAGKVRRPSLVAGHSLGFWAALVTAGALPEEAGFDLVSRARELAGEAAGGESCAAGAVVGLRPEEIGELLARFGRDGLAITAVNSALSQVVGGWRGAVEEFLAEAESRGALRTALLEINLPYHHPEIMAAAAEPFRRFVRGLPWRRPRIPVLSPMTGRPLATIESLEEAAARSIAAPVHWDRVLTALSHAGVVRAYECGPGMSLTQHARFQEGAPPHLNLRTLPAGCR